MSVVTIKLDTIGAAAVDLARAAAQEAAGHVLVGEHLGAHAEADRMVVHRFATTDLAYRGWEWTVVVVRIPRARVATVDEVVLLPGPGALLAPSWVPWSERIAPGDLGETDLLPFREDDPLLDPGFEQVGGADAALGDEAFDDLDRNLLTELGYGRARVLNAEGRDEAAVRWYGGDAGPETATARAAGASCATCGYLVGLTGSLRTMFGVCANAWSPDDGRAVSFEHGCGAHSETGIEESREGHLSDPLIDQLREELDVGPLLAPLDGPAEAHSLVVDLDDVGDLLDEGTVEDSVDVVVDELVVADSIEETVDEDLGAEPVVDGPSEASTLVDAVDVPDPDVPDPDVPDPDVPDPDVPELDVPEPGAVDVPERDPLAADER